jgi:hypothetical protein
MQILGEIYYAPPESAADWNCPNAARKCPVILIHAGSVVHFARLQVKPDKAVQSGGSV